MTEYFIEFWGRDEEQAIRELGLSGPRHWFRTQVELDNLRAKLKPYHVVSRTESGEMTHKRTVAIVKLAFGGKFYTLEHDFGFEYPAHSAEYMFEDGNYSCDCNRSLFIGEKHEEFPEMECGNLIEMVEFHTELREPYEEAAIP